MKNIHQIPNDQPINDRGDDRPELDGSQEDARAPSPRRAEADREMDPSAPSFYAMDFQVRSLESLFAADMRSEAALVREQDAAPAKEEYYDHHFPADKLSSWRADQRPARGLPQASALDDDSIAHYLPPRRPNLK